MSLGSNGVEWVRLLRKIPTPLRCTNFYTSSALFAPSFVTQPKGHKCTQILWNAPKHLFRVQWGGSGAFIAKISDATSWHELLHHFGPLCTEFVWQPNGPKCFKIIRNAPKHEFRVQWGGSRAFIGKNSHAASWHEVLLQFGPFCTYFQKSTKRSQMHQNCTNAQKHEFRVQWGGSRAWLRKIPMRLRGMNFCTSSARFAPSFVSQPNGRNATKLYEMQQNMSLKSNRIYRVCSFRKISMLLRATNFCTSSAHFASSFVS